MSALHFIGKTDTKEEMLVLNQHKEQAVLKTLLEDRDPHLYREIYGLKNVRDVYDPHAGRQRQERLAVVRPLKTVN